MSEAELEAARARVRAAVLDPSGYLPLLTAAARLGRGEELAAWLADQLPFDEGRAAAEVAFLDALCRARVCLGNPRPPGSRVSVDPPLWVGSAAVWLRDHGVEVLDGPGMTRWRRLDWPGGGPRPARSLALPDCRQRAWLLLFGEADATDPVEGGLLLCLDPGPPEWVVVQRAPGRRWLGTVDWEAGAVTLRFAPGAEGPRGEPAETLSFPPPPAPGPDPDHGLLPARYGLRRSLPLQLAFVPSGDAVVAEYPEGRRRWDLASGLAADLPGPPYAGESTELGRLADAADFRWTSEVVDDELVVSLGRRGQPLQPARIPTSGRRGLDAILQPRAGRVLVVHPEGAVEAWRVGGSMRAWRSRILDLDGEVRALADPGEGCLVLIQAGRAEAYVFDAQGGDLVARARLPDALVPGHEGGLRRAAVLACRDDRFLLLRSRDGLGWIDLRGGATRALEHPAPESLPAPSQLAAAEHGSQLVLVTATGALAWIDPWTGDLLAEDLRRPALPGTRPEGAPTRVALRGDGRQLVYSEGPCLRLVDLTGSGRARGPLPPTAGTGGSPGDTGG